MKRSLALLMVLASVAFASPAFADSGSRKHDGFHFSLQGGIGYYTAGDDSTGTFSGMTLPSALLMGGTVGGRVALGGGVVFDYSPSPTYEFGGSEMSGDFSQMIIGLGLYADYYFDPVKNGLHVQLFAGWGGLETSANGNVGGSDPTGLVSHVGVGYEVWIAHEWSVGVLARLTYAPLSFNNVDITVIQPAVVGTLTWH